jgi:hypothetical protein
MVDYVLSGAQLSFEVRDGPCGFLAAVLQPGGAGSGLLMLRSQR